MRMLDRRRARSTSLRMEPEDVRRKSSLWIPAFMAAAAASECGGVCEVGDGDMLRAGSAELELMMRAGWDDEAEGEGEGGSELISGIALYAILQQEFVFEQRNDYRSVTVQFAGQRQRGQEGSGGVVRARARARMQVQPTSDAPTCTA
jgi:hypothetical protein